MPAESQPVAFAHVWGLSILFWFLPIYSRLACFSLALRVVNFRLSPVAKFHSSLMAMLGTLWLALRKPIRLITWDPSVCFAVDSCRWGGGLACIGSASAMLRISRRLITWARSVFAAGS